MKEKVVLVVEAGVGLLYAIENRKLLKTRCADTLNPQIKQIRDPLAVHGDSPVQEPYPNLATWFRRIAKSYGIRTRYAIPMSLTPKLFLFAALSALAQQSDEKKNAAVAAAQVLPALSQPVPVMVAIPQPFVTKSEASAVNPIWDLLKASLPVLGVLVGSGLTFFVNRRMLHHQTSQAAHLKRLEKRSDAYASMLRRIGRLLAVTESRRSLEELAAPFLAKGEPLPGWIAELEPETIANFKEATFEFRDQLDAQALFLSADARQIVERMRQSVRPINPATSKADFLYNINSLKAGYSDFLAFAKRDVGYHT